MSHVTTEPRPLTPAELRIKALGLREEARAKRSTLKHGRAIPDEAQRRMREAAQRMECLASELERAAQRAEATGV
jgi:hypothetical protein